MVCLILAVLSSFSISLLVKVNEGRGVNTQIVLAANYISASVLGWIFVLSHGITAISPITIGLGLGGGLLWPAVFYLHIWGIRQYGLSRAGSIARLSLSIPVVFAIMFLGEHLTWAIGLGIAGTFAAFFLLTPPTIRDGHTPSAHQPPNAVDRRALWYFPLLVFSFGIADVWVNLFNIAGPGTEKFLFVVFIFSAAAVFMWGAIIVQKIQVDHNAFLRGLLLGIPNFFSTFCLMEALKAPLFTDLSAVVYALYSVTGVTLAFIAGALIWKEQVNKRNIAGVIVAIFAIALLNLP